MEHVRRSPIAGTWYPGHPETLRHTVRLLLDQARVRSLRGTLLGLISPHAGIQYSGATAAHAYKLVEGRSYQRVIILGPSHFAYVGDVATTPVHAWETPLGQVPLDWTFLQRLSERITVYQVGHDREHSIEMQLPFLQVALGDFQLVPLLMSAYTAESARTIGQALAELVNPATDLLVASTDLSHLNDYREVEQQDAEMITALTAFDIKRFAEIAERPTCTACGRFPVLTLLYAARALGATDVLKLHYTHSGEVTGQMVVGQYTVGYLAAALVRYTTGDLVR